MTTRRDDITLPDDIAPTVRLALAEDIGTGDLTAALLPAGARAEAQVITREDIVLCGSAWFEETFRQLDAGVIVTWRAHEAGRVQAGTTLCTLSGPVRSLLSGERTALNFLQLLSGTATTTHRFVDAVAGTRAVILDTRKTLPGLRRAQKYAVACGGGQNHRMGLFAGILIKENHIAAAGSIPAVLQAAQKLAPPGMMVEIEVENLTQLDEALAAGARQILLDNFTLEELREAVRRTGTRATLEASGGVSIESVREIAATGVHYISIGGLTKHVRAADLSLRFVQESPRNLSPSRA